MSPGFTGSITRLGDVADAFVSHGFAVLMYDQRTCGRPKGIRRPMSATSSAGVTST
nr:alpha/beta hydrolase [Mycobacterium cookii]